MKSRYRNMTPEKANEIRRLYFDRTDPPRLRQWQLAKMFGTSQTAVSRIISDQTWVQR